MAWTSNPCHLVQPTALRLHKEAQFCFEGFAKCERHFNVVNVYAIIYDDRHFA